MIIQQAKKRLLFLAIAATRSHDVGQMNSVICQKVYSLNEKEAKIGSDLGFANLMKRFNYSEEQKGEFCVFLAI